MKLKRFLKNSARLALLLSLACLCLSCQKKEEIPEPKKNPQEIFLKSFHNTLKLDTPVYINARMAGSTLWIYIATEKEILNLDRKQATGEEDKKETIFLQIKGDYAGNFQFYYDIFRLRDLPATTFEEEISGKGITESYTKLMHDLTQKVFTSLMDLIYALESKDLKFFVFCVADIQKGIEIKTIINRSDLEKLMVGIITSEQFYGTRTLMKEKGDEAIVGDKTGKHLDYKDIIMENFITELTSQRSRLEFAKLKTEDKNEQNLKDIILKSVYEFTKIYEFENFYGVEMTDVAANRKETVGRYEITERFKDSGL